MAWTEQQSLLRNTLAGLFPDKDETRSLLDEAGIPTIQIALGERPITNWHEVIRQAEQRGLLSPLLNAVLSRYPRHPVITAVLQGQPLIPPPAISWRGGPAAPTLEKITGLRSTLLPISFLEGGLEAARSVARVVVPSGYGTGFLLKHDLLVTNNHVLATRDEAAAAVIEFNYQTSRQGLDAKLDTFKLDPDALFETSVQHDWTLVKVADASGRSANAEWGFLRLAAQDARLNQNVNIIQHPGGGPKHIALYHNYVAYADTDIAQYLTDTLPGSSGAPVFNDAWEVVAVHHSGGMLEEPSSKSTFLRNEGIQISILKKKLAELRLA